MNKVGVWSYDKVLQHPDVHQSSTKLDVAVDLLDRKICPVHLLPLIQYREFVDVGGEYRRRHYICLRCPCKAEFVGDELKSDSVLRTFDTIEAMTLEIKEMAGQQSEQDSSTDDGISV